MLESVCVCVCVLSFYVFMPGYFPLPSQIFWRLIIKCDSANKAFYAKNPLQQKKRSVYSIQSQMIPFLCGLKQVVNQCPFPIIAYEKQQALILHNIKTTARRSEARHTVSSCTTIPVVIWALDFYIKSLNIL